MISCKECATLNSLDSAFCKKCGKPLAQEEALDAREHMEKQLDHAYELFHHGRTDEAWLNVEGCLISDPTNLRAISLKAMILERRGLIPEALECYETIVAKDPNAALERMKLQTLRGLMEVRHLNAQQPNKKLALGLAVCATLLVVSLGAAIAVGRSPKPANVVAQQPEQPRYSVDSSFTAPPVGKAVKQTDSSQDGSQPDSANNGDNTGDENTPSNLQARPLRGSAGPSLPNPSDESNAASQDFSPVDPLKNAQIEPMQSQTSDAGNSSNGNIGANNNNQQQDNNDPDPSTVNTPTDTKPVGPPPVVNIKLSDDKPPKDSDLAIDANGIEAMVRTARGQYQVGNYQAAAGTYERALSAGADPALTNQRLAQCYERLGRTSEAKAAYTKAISAIQGQINGGRGNKDRLMAALSSSQQALKNLQGG